MPFVYPCKKCFVGPEILWIYSTATCELSRMHQHSPIIQTESINKADSHLESDSKHPHARKGRCWKGYHDNQIFNKFLHKQNILCFLSWRQLITSWMYKVKQNCFWELLICINHFVCVCLARSWSAVQHKCQMTLWIRSFSFELSQILDLCFSGCKSLS